jgi:hypothetical protein
LINTAYVLRTCSVSKEYLMDVLEDHGDIDLEQGDTITSITIQGEMVTFAFDVKEE